MCGHLEGTISRRNILPGADFGGQGRRCLVLIGLNLNDGLSARRVEILAHF